MAVSLMGDLNLWLSLRIPTEKLGTGGRQGSKATPGPHRAKPRVANTMADFLLLLI